MKYKFSHYNNWFPTDDKIDEMIEFIQVPPRAEAIIVAGRKVPGPNMKFKYLEAIDSQAKINLLSIRSKLFTVKDNNLVLKSDNLLVVRKPDAENIIKQLYDDPKVGLAKGIHGMYKYIQTKYLNIKRSVVSEFMKRQNPYQLTQPITHRINKPILSNHPNELWAIDLIDYNQIESHNGGFKYIMTIVDIFSGMTFLGKLKNKGAEDIKQLFIRICNEKGVMPRHLMMDNGTEFKEPFSTFCKENNIKIHLSRTYSPESNGVVENKNNFIRRKIRELFVRTNKLSWIQNLSDIETNINHSYNSSKRDQPKNLWTPSNIKPDALSVKGNDSYNYQVKQAQKKIIKFQSTEFEVGDYVRIKVTSIYSAARKLVKQGLSKQLVVTYTPEVFRVYHKIDASTKGVERAKYLLESLTTGYYYPRNKFYASELIEASKNEKGTITNKDAMKLNQIEETIKDIVIADRSVNKTTAEKPTLTMAMLVDLLDPKAAQKKKEKKIVEIVPRQTRSKTRAQQMADELAKL